MSGPASRDQRRGLPCKFPIRRQLLSMIRRQAGAGVASSQVVANETSSQSGFGSSVQIQLSPEAQRYLAGPAAPQPQTMSLTSGSGPENPDGTTTTVGDVVVIGQKRTLFTVEIQLPAPPEWVPDVAEIGAEPPGEMPPVELTPCQKETLKDRAALEAKKIIDGLPKNKEWGMYLIRDPDGSIRGVGPIEGRYEGGRFFLDWDATPTELGISSWSQLVGLVHNHPMDNSGDTQAYQFSPEDEEVTAAFAPPIRISGNIYP